ncbi:uncharacterized protein LOC126857460 [Cataglyphis hispanica]|uniref:uncharacterized protein LOC126857460 n=1 Tax=Cataglyphis hispanica TaxID=1086592 RepID=UPI00217F4027|nr:uncharacterized protein LOC126857460 [Cataglyphis hispanica]
MKGIYVITVAFLVSWSVCTAHKSQQFIQETGPLDNIVRECPTKDPVNTTIHLAHENDCTKFYKCFAGRRTEELCPLMWKDDPYKRLHFNRALQVCDWPWQAGCESCLEPDKNGYYPPDFWIAAPNNGDCRRYIICRSDGGQQSGICPSDQCFSRTCQACVRYPEGGSCSGNITPTSTPTQTPKPTPTLRPICENNKRRKHECDCSKYYQCENNEEYVHQCENGQHFSPRGEECKPADEAGCSLPKLIPKINIKKN